MSAKIINLTGESFRLMDTNTGNILQVFPEKENINSFFENAIGNGDRFSVENNDVLIHITKTHVGAVEEFDTKFPPIEKTIYVVPRNIATHLKHRSDIFFLLHKVHKDNVKDNVHLALGTYNLSDVRK